jgi:ornithine--oxo-acid transaminase
MTANLQFFPKMRTQDYVELENLYGAHNYRPLDVVITEAKGVWLYDVEGRKYLDCLAAYSAVNQGHCHPKIMETVIRQAQRLTLTSRAFRNDQLPLLCKELHELTGMDVALPMNSGTEAVETALKAARKWGYTVKGIPPDQGEIVVCANNFHGRTITIVSFSTEPQYRDGFGPFTPGFVVIPYDDVDALRRAVTPRTCAFLVEPIQGEAGIILPREGYLRDCYEICRDRRVLFIADEVQSGLGRTGSLFAYMHEDVLPDLVVVGKALSGGYYPVSAVLGSRQVLEVFKPGDHGSTFGGNPMACAIARSALHALIEEGMAERSAELGAYFLDRLKAISSQQVKDVRGRGLWIGMELRGPARPFCEALKEEGILCKETHDRVLRIAPPLVITREEIDWALVRFARVLR